MPFEATVFVVDDDVQARKSVCALVQSMGLHARSFASAEEFLEQYQEGLPGCVVADLRLPGMSGLELQDQLLRRKIPLPVIILTGYARTTTTVRAMQGGAVTVLDKPYADDDLWDAIRAALAREAAGHANHLRRQAIRERMSRLIPAERLVLDLLVGGSSNKQIAVELGVSLRTVENRRHDIFAKLQVATLVELVRAVMDADAAERDV